VQLSPSERRRLHTSALHSIKIKVYDRDSSLNRIPSDLSYFLLLLLLLFLFFWFDLENEPNGSKCIHAPAECVFKLICFFYSLIFDKTNNIGRYFFRGTYTKSINLLYSKPYVRTFKIYCKNTKLNVTVVYSSQKTLVVRDRLDSCTIPI